MPGCFISGVVGRMTQQVKSNKLDGGEEKQDDDRCYQRKLDRNRCGPLKRGIRWTISSTIAMG